LIWIAIVRTTAAQKLSVKVFRAPAANRPHLFRALSVATIGMLQRGKDLLHLQCVFVKGCNKKISEEAFGISA
jgi:hypothetical protein